MQERGRHGVARRALPAGTPLLEEEAVVARLIPQFATTHCDHCLMRYLLPI